MGRLRNIQCKSKETLRFTQGDFENPHVNLVWYRSPCKSRLPPSRLGRVGIQALPSPSPLTNPPVGACALQPTSLAWRQAVCTLSVIKSQPTKTSKQSRSSRLSIHVRQSNPTKTRGSLLFWGHPYQFFFPGGGGEGRWARVHPTSQSTRFRWLFANLNDSSRFS